MAVVSMKQLLEAGIHFGHSAKKTHYKAKKYLFAANNQIPLVRNKIHIIDLKKTIEHIEIAYKQIYQIISSGGKILFLGTKKQIQEIIQKESQRCQQYYVNHRWLGGTFTNFQTIAKRIDFLKTLYKQEKEGFWDHFSKKEIMKLTKKREKLEKFLGGIKNMKTLPQAIFIVDTQKDVIAIAEARKLNIKIFGIIDSNCDPDLVDYVIPANNDAIKGVKLITSIIANAVVEALKISAINTPEINTHTNIPSNNIQKQA
ncbi:30S ribosomal protein S2 [Candidatus Phytoplasma melaleucae]|uniref:Small ribosomal subunit protein uS2 n=1 Tax=Candidatus Phytoplasma melaleucae TaxID=2982630 RepID=A0ABT9DCZ1_9MOLU|nr:30S ribosomal protein S2 ['Melaleuca sp.' phytoplasma]MDO8167968.1 30S ribosomal protein S2 ['Melaleuca sp.' phytoplasma]